MHTQASKWYKIIACVGSSHLGIKWICHCFWNAKKWFSGNKYYECCMKKSESTLNITYFFLLAWLATTSVDYIREFWISFSGIIVCVFVRIEFVAFCWWHCPKAFSLMYNFWNMQLSFDHEWFSFVNITYRVAFELILILSIRSNGNQCNNSEILPTASLVVFNYEFWPIFTSNYRLTGDRKKNELTVILVNWEFIDFLIVMLRTCNKSIGICYSVWKI